MNKKLIFLCGTFLFLLTVLLMGGFSVVAEESNEEDSEYNEEETAEDAEKLEEEVGELKEQENRLRGMKEVISGLLGEIE